MTQYIKTYISPTIENEFPIQYLTQTELDTLISKYNLTKSSYLDEIIPDESHYQLFNDEISIKKPFDKKIESFNEDLYYAYGLETDINLRKLLMLSKLYDINKETSYYNKLIRFLTNYKSTISSSDIIQQIDSLITHINADYKKSRTSNIVIPSQPVTEEYRNKILFSQGNKAARLSIPYYIQPNRKIFPLFIKGQFQNRVNELPFKPIRIWNPTNEKYEDKIPFNQQKFVTYFLSENTPYRGILLYHGLGSGKTGASIMIAEGFRNRQVVILLPASLRTNYENEILRFGESAYKQQFFWEFIELPDDPITGLLDNYVVNDLVLKGIDQTLLNTIITTRNNKKGIFMITL